MRNVSSSFPPITQGGGEFQRISRTKKSFSSSFKGKRVSLAGDRRDGSCWRDNFSSSSSSGQKIL